VNRATSLILVSGLFLLTSPARAASVVFDFDGGPLHAQTPLTQVAGGITAQFTATGQGYSIQPADVLGFTPAGMSGYVLYPNSVFASDLSIAFDQPLTGISMLFAPEEYATDSSATLQLTAYSGASPVGSSTASASPPGTWPTGTLLFSSAQPFDHVVVHYLAPPPTGGDYGPIFMIDNVAVVAIPEPSTITLGGFGLILLGLALRRRTMGCEASLAPEGTGEPARI